MPDPLEEIERLRGMIDQTADGVLIPDCEKLFCPDCGGEVYVFPDGTASCSVCCPEGDDWCESTDCYSSHEAWEKAKENGK